MSKVSNEAGFKVKIENIPESAVSEEIDRELRNLLVTCFGLGFRNFRSPRSVPMARFLAHDGDLLIGHVACHVKTLICAARSYLTVGIAEACVLPEYRGRAVLKSLLSDMHDAMPSDYEFALLFGFSKYYRSSGYFNVYNLSNAVGEIYADVMVREMTAQARWPTSEVYLLGARF